MNTQLNEFQNLISKALHHFSMLLMFCKFICNKWFNFSVYQWSALSNKHDWRFCCNDVVFIINIMTQIQFIKLKTLWYNCLSFLTLTELSLKFELKKLMFFDWKKWLSSLSLALLSFYFDDSDSSNRFNKSEELNWQFVIMMTATAS